jgi:uncharacterized membrane protein YadS
MKKLALIACALYAVNHYAAIDLRAVAHLSDYIIAVLIAMLIQPWVVQQIDA